MCGSRNRLTLTVRPTPLPPAPHPRSADSDCGGCCSANTGRGKYTLIDLEKWPASALLGFSTTSPSFDINNVAMPTAAGKRPGAPELSVMPLCYKVLGSSTARSLARSKKGE